MTYEIGDKVVFMLAGHNGDSYSNWQEGEVVDLCVLIDNPEQPEQLGVKVKWATSKPRMTGPFWNRVWVTNYREAWIASVQVIGMVCDIPTVAQCKEKLQALERMMASDDEIL